MNFTGNLISGDVNVLGPGAVLTITLSSPANYGQGPFAVETERVDAAAGTISAVTLQGHPLAGWRYWRVYSIGINDLVIETGAYDSPGPGPKNYTGYYLASGKDGMISRGWREYMEYILKQPDLGAYRGLKNKFDVGGVGIDIPADDLLTGFWDRFDMYTPYILNNVCQSTSCN